MSFVLSLPVDVFLELVEKAAEEHLKDRAFQVWIAQLPWAPEEHRMSFEEFWQSVSAPRQISRKTKYDIISDVANIRRALRR